VASSAVAALTDGSVLPTAAVVLTAALVACALRAWTARHSG